MSRPQIFSVTERTPRQDAAPHYTRPPVTKNMFSRLLATLLWLLSNANVYTTTLSTNLILLTPFTLALILNTLIDALTSEVICHQGRNHFFKVGGPIPWSWSITEQIGMVYPVSCTAVSYEKDRVVRPNFRGVRTPTLQWLRHVTYVTTMRYAFISYFEN